MQDWLRDRWQAAGDMNGTPLPGPHWLQVFAAAAQCRTSFDHGRKVSLQQPSLVFRVAIDWETAHCSDYVVTVRLLMVLIDLASDSTCFRAALVWTPAPVRLRRADGR
jgi:hypothetical protein